MSMIDENVAILLGICVQLFRTTSVGSASETTVEF